MKTGKLHNVIYEINLDLMPIGSIRHGTYYCMNIIGLMVLREMALSH